MSGKLTTFDEVLAATAGELPVASGSRTTAQHLDHCAASIVASLDGYPALKPWIVRATVGKLVKYVFLWRGTMHHDTSAPVPGGPTLPDRPVAEAQAALAAAVERFRAHAGGLRPHPVYGGCSKTQYERLHSIHAADHLRTIRGQA